MFITQWWAITKSSICAGRRRTRVDLWGKEEVPESFTVAGESKTGSGLVSSQGLVLVSWKVHIRSLLNSRCQYCTWYDGWSRRGRFWLHWKGFVRWGVSITIGRWWLEACYFRWNPVAICCFHAVRCASKLRANKLSDVAERARYFYDQIVITSSCLVAIREEVH